MPPIQEQILVANMPDVRPLASILRSLSFRAQATLKIDEAGIRVTVEEGRSLQAHAYVAANAFSSYTFHLAADDPAAYVDAPRGHTDSPGSSPAAAVAVGEEAAEGLTSPYCQMSVSLSTILECLNIFGNAGAAASNTFKKEGGYDSDGGGDDAGGGGGGGGGSRWRGKRKRQGAADDDDEDGDGRYGKRGGKRETADEGKTTSLRLSYAGHGEPLVMLLEESGIVTRCEITTYEPEGLLDLAFNDEDKIQRLIIKSDWLHDALLEVPTSSEKLSISFSPSDANEDRYRRQERNRRRKRETRRQQAGPEGLDEDDEEEQEVDDDDEEVPLFRLESVGPMGSTEMDYSDDKDVLEIFECEQALRNSYKYSHILLTRHALSVSIKTSIRTDAHGLVSFQFMIPMSTRGPKASMREGKIGFVEFLCVALDEEY
ncbi:hypothetical protein JCM8115_006975 [Rhodotorula mucilaginosa]